MRDLLLVGVDDGSDVVVDVAGKAELDKSRVHEPRLFWRSVPVDLHNVSSWAFEIELIGWPGPTANAGLIASSDKQREINKLFARQMTEPKKLESESPYWPEYDEAVESGVEFPWVELGRIRLAAFAFDTSIATKGTPLGRVARRKDR